ncbi:hypothetical protein GYMLUDRAFT_35076 [Collybiopsis luxurians FD-317 M1]|nr:hypothetical protein GYMLUDRAFT_35076 [Collybiopsis luxurians FD-317 M1]
MSSTATHPTGQLPLELSALFPSNANHDILAQVEAPPLNGNTSDVQSLNSRASSLPPADFGFYAWAYLASAWVLDCLLWGIPFCYGVFLDYYHNSSPTMKSSSLTLLTLVGTLNTGILYISPIVLLPLLNRYPMHKMKVSFVGYLLAVGGLVGAAFARNAGELILAQGVLFSVGGSLLYYPMMTWLFEWFDAKRGLANGILFTGASVGGVFGPFIIQALLSKYGQKVTLLALAISIAILVIPCFLFLKPRLPVSRAVSVPKLNDQFMRSRVFWILVVFNILQGLGNFIPYIYLPTFASSLGLSGAQRTMGVALLNGASMVGMILIGGLSDYNLRLSMTLSSVGATLTVFLLWGLSPTVPSYAIFSFTYGFLAPSWGTQYPRFASACAENDPRLVSVLVSIFLAGRGLGNVLSSPISTSLMHQGALTNTTSLVYGLEGYVIMIFGPLILFTGTTLLVSALGAAY